MDKFESIICDFDILAFLIFPFILPSSFIYLNYSLYSIWLELRLRGSRTNSSIYRSSFDWLKLILSASSIFFRR